MSCRSGQPARSASVIPVRSPEEATNQSVVPQKCSPSAAAPCVFRREPLSVSGDIVFDGIESDKVDIYLATSGAKINAGTLGDEVKISIATGYSGVFAPGAASQADKFPSTDFTVVWRS